MQVEIDGFRIGQKVLKLIDKKESNVKCSEVYLRIDNILNLEIEENSIKNSRMKLKKGISVRCVDNRGACGFAFTNRFQEKNLEDISQTAVKLMKNGTNDPDFHDFPSEYQKYPQIPNLFDKNIEEIKVEDTAPYAIELINVCKNDDMAISQSGAFHSQCTQIYILNSNGIEVSEKRTYSSLYSNMILKDSTTKDTSFGYEHQSVRNLEFLNAKKVASNALNDGKRNLNRIKIENMKVPLVLTPKGTINLILEPLSSAINAETFQYKRSFLVGRQGKKIGSRLITIEDNGLVDGGIGSRTFDAEGVPCKNKTIIEEGKFMENGLLHNSYSAYKEGVKSSGNATRSSYSSIPNIGETNLIFNSGDTSKENMIEGIKKGILFDYTGDSANIATGDFSGLILHGNLIKDGKISDPLNETMFGINLFNLFSNVTAVSREDKVYGNYKAPYVKVEDVNIIGSK